MSRTPSYPRQCRHCGEQDLTRLVKRKDRPMGVETICYTCRKDTTGEKQNAKRRVQNGYTIVESSGHLEKGACLSYQDIHWKFSKHEIPDGTIVQSNKSGRLFEVWNTPQLIPVEST